MIPKYECRYSIMIHALILLLFLCILDDASQALLLFLCILDDASQALMSAFSTRAAP